MSLPKEFTGSPSPVEADGGLMGMIGPPPSREERSETTGLLHVNRSTLILPAAEAAESASAMDYLDEHNEISHVLLAGADGLGLPADRLREIFALLAARKHVRMIRLYSTLPAQQPERISANEELLGLLSEYSDPGRSLYVMMRFHRPEEAGEDALEAFHALNEAGAGLVAEVPIVAGVNAEPDMLAETLKRLTRANVIPYQFVIEPSSAERAGAGIALERAYRLAEAVKTRISGPARRARLIVSHPRGYYEVLAIDNGQAYVKAHLSGDHDNGRFLILDCPPHASRLEDGPAKLRKRTGKLPSDATYLKVPYEIPD